MATTRLYAVLSASEISRINFSNLQQTKDTVRYSTDGKFFIVKYDSDLPIDPLQYTTPVISGESLTKTLTTVDTQTWEVFDLDKDSDTKEYIEKIKPIDTTNQRRIFRFITELKKINLWQDVYEGWLLGKNFNKGSGNTVYALKNNINNGTIVYNSQDSGITWENDGLRFYTNTTSQNKVPRVEITNWNAPNLTAPMSIAIITSPLLINDSPSKVRCVFGKTSVGGGTGSHFGFNFNFIPNKFDFYYGFNSANGGFWTEINPLSAWWFSGLSTDGITVSAFANGRYARPGIEYSDIYTFTSGTVLDKIYFGNTTVGNSSNEYDGIIQAGFIFNKSIDFDIFYEIYKNTLGQDLDFIPYP